MGLVESRGAGESLPPPDFLRPIVEAIQQLDGIQAQLLTASDEDGWTVPVVLIADDDGVINESLLILTEASRPRRLAAFSLASSSTLAVLVAVESQSCVPFMYAINADEYSHTSIFSRAAMGFVRGIQHQVWDEALDSASDSPIKCVRRILFHQSIA
jgi:hypothetical protein